MLFSPPGAAELLTPGGGSPRTSLCHTRVSHLAFPCPTVPVASLRWTMFAHTGVHLTLHLTLHLTMHLTDKICVVPHELTLGFRQLMKLVDQFPLEERRQWATVLRMYASSLSKGGPETPTTPTNGNT
jgi:hypothetical protein